MSNMEVSPDKYFYDTSSLLLAGEKLFEQKSNSIFYISSITLKELESIKTSYNKEPDIKYSARLITRLLEQYPEKYQVIPHKVDNEEIIIAAGFAINDDTRILSDAIACNEHDDIIFVTNDLSLKHIANCFFGHKMIERISEEEDGYTGYVEVRISNEVLNDFYQNPEKNIFNLLPGQYLIVKSKENEIVDLRVWDGEEYKYLSSKPINSKTFGKVTPYKGDIYQKMLFDSLKNNTLTMVKGPAGSGKAQPNSTLIPTKKGYVRLGDIKVGDKILDKNGEETKVLKVFPQGLREKYKITFSDGRIAYCNNGHLWSCYKDGVLVEYTVQEMLNMGLKDSEGHWKFIIPNSQPIAYKEKKFKLNPYLAGIRLGNENKVDEDYEFCSIDQRFKFLQGVLDVNEQLKFTNLKLVKIIQKICWSLGMQAPLSQESNGSYSLKIFCKDSDIGKLSMKDDIRYKMYSQNRYRESLIIKSIDKLCRYEEMTCLLVDNPEHLYLTEQYIVTHNTFISLAYLMNELEHNNLDKIIVFCNTIATANSARLGFYPGTRLEKLLDSQIGNVLSSKFGGRDKVEKLIEDKKLEILPFSDLRGYDTSGMRAGIYISEAQNLDRTLIKLALQRVGEDCICIIDGDERTQVDDIHFSGANNGMRRVSKVFRGKEKYGEVALKNVYRSRIAAIAEEI